MTDDTKKIELLPRTAGKTLKLQQARQNKLKHNFSAMFSAFMNMSQAAGASIRKLPTVWWSDPRSFESAPKVRKITRATRKHIDMVIDSRNKLNERMGCHFYTVNPKKIRRYLRNVKRVKSLIQQCGSEKDAMRIISTVATSQNEAMLLRSVCLNLTNTTGRDKRTPCPGLFETPDG